MKKPIVVIKVGGEALYTSTQVWVDIECLVRKRGFGVLLVLGGSSGIKRAYQRQGWTEPKIKLAGGDEVRFCPPSEMSRLGEIYATEIVPYAAQKLSERGLVAFCASGPDRKLFVAKKYPAFKIINNGRIMIERSSMVGEIVSVASQELTQLLSIYDVVVVSPPVIDDSGNLINVDADQLAAHGAAAVEASHVWFVTSSAGILRDPADKSSTIPDLYLPISNGDIKVEGRMKQKVRACDYIVSHTLANISVISSATSILDPVEGMMTRVWRFGHQKRCDSILTRLVQIPSTSRFENEAANLLKNEMNRLGFITSIDGVGNAVGKIGAGSKRLMLLGHIDTVPGKVPLTLENNILSGRGTVDAKAALCCFIEAVAPLRDIAASMGVEISVVGAVEEEVYSSKGAFHVRDTLMADAVIIGEPSGYNALTLGYKGLFKFKGTISQPHSHSASSEYKSSTDRILGFVSDLQSVAETVPQLSYSTRSITTSFSSSELAEVEGTFRVPPGTAVSDISSALNRTASKNGVEICILRQTPGYREPVISELVRCFRKSAELLGRPLKLIHKSGTSDMNTLCTKWKVPMVAYGPGDSRLDHTDNEHIDFVEYDAAVALLRSGIQQWMQAQQTKEIHHGYNGIGAENSAQVP